MENLPTIVGVVLLVILTHGLFEGAVEPAVVDHVLDGDRWVLQVLKRVHQDEV